MAEQSEPPYACTIVNVILASAAVTRHQPDLPDDFDFDEQPPNIDVTASVMRVDGRDDLFVALLRMSVALTAEQNKKLLSIDVAYHGYFEVAAPSSEEALSFLQPRVAAIISPYVNQFVADLIMRAGLPPLFLPPLDVFAQKQQHVAGEEPSPTIQ